MSGGGNGPRPPRNPPRDREEYREDGPHIEVPMPWPPAPRAPAPPKPEPTQSPPPKKGPLHGRQGGP